jgi:PAS domain S-box-containing protein
MPSEWLALVAGGRLRQSWERLLALRELKSEPDADWTSALRRPIVESWKRSLDTGLDPLDLLAPLEADPDEMQERWAEHPLGSLAHVLHAQLGDIARESRSLLVVSDASGLLLHIEGPESLKTQAAEMNFVEGAKYSEAAAGTNGIGTVLAAGHALQVFASEHFNQRHHGWACSGAPVHDPVSGRVLGVVDLSSPWLRDDPLSLAFPAAAARALEQCLADVRLHSDARLRRRYADLATRTSDLLVSPDGYVLAGGRPPTSSKPITIPESGGEIVLDDGSVAAVESLGHGEAYLVRRIDGPGVGAAPRTGPAPAKEEADEALPTAVETDWLGTQVGSRIVGAYFDAALDCIILADASGRVVEFNAAAERTFGYSRAEALGRTMAELIVPSSLRERHSTAFARFIETGNGTILGRRVELTGMRADGSEFPVELTLSQVEVEPLLICGVLRDISAAKEAEHHVRELAEEQAALRRVATLVARESSSQQLFALVAEQVARIIGVPLVRVVRYEPDGSAAELIGGWGESVDPLAVGTRWQLDGPGVLASVWRSSLPARLDDYTDQGGAAAAVVRQAGMRSAVASPIVVEGRLWGAIAVLSPSREGLPESTEARLTDFTELVATAIANADSRAAIARLADEQAALRRVATLVARGVRPAEIFSAVSEEVQQLFGLDEETLDVATVVRFDPGPQFTLVGAGKRIEGLPLGACWGPNDLYVSTRVHRTGRFARVDETDLMSAGGPDAETLRRQGLISQVASPILVEGRLWGAITVNTRARLLLDTEERLGRFTDLVATAISNTESRTELAASEGRARRLAEEQAALRRVATLVARESLPEELFAVIAEEVGHVLSVPIVVVIRYEEDGSVMRVEGGWSERPFPVPMGTRLLLDGPSHFADVWATGRSARLDDVADLPGQIASAMRQADVGSGAASPIVVEGAIWGAVAVGLFGFSDRLADDIEARLADFTELVATALANAENRAALRRLADQQATLRRVATLVAKGSTGQALFSAVAREVARLFGVSMVSIDRYENGESVVLASFGVPEFPVGSRWPLDGPGVRALVHETGRPARVDDFSEVAGTAPTTARVHGIDSVVGVPIVVDGNVWGILGIGSRQGETLPSDVEQHLAAFTELVSTAIANSDARDQVRGLLDEQSALRRVATLVAEGASVWELFSAVAEEVAGVVGLPVVGVHRYDPDGTFTMVGVAGETTFAVGSRWPVADEGLSGMILASGRPARKDDYSTMSGPVGVAVRDDRMASMVGVPILVDGRVWGFMVAGGGPGETIPASTETHLARFTELIATAVSNTTMRAELAASRARVIAAADDARRRIERDLHDGAQQQLVTLALGLRSAEARVPAALEDVRAEVRRFADRLTTVVEELREMSRGIHPAILTEGGLPSALEALALRSAVPVKLNVRCEDRFPEEVEVAAYYVVSEALTNAAKHADASHVRIDLRAEEETLLLSILDDGSGGADPIAGSGLIGLKDRVEALGGTIEIHSPLGSGTRLDVEIPLVAGPSDSPRLAQVWIQGSRPTARVPAP